MAVRPPHHLQPRLGAARRIARGASARSSYGGTPAKREWTGLDVPDFTATKPPDYRPPKAADGDEALPGDAPFIMHADGVGWIWVPIGTARRPAADALRAARVAVRERALSRRIRPIPPADRKERPGNRLRADRAIAASRTC